MSETKGYTTTARRSRGGSIRVYNIDPETQVVHGISVPRSTYVAGNSIGIIKGDYVYPKPGQTVFFYQDANGTQLVGRSSGQVNDPSRSGGELVGVATGQVSTTVNGVFIGVEWLNSYVDHNFLKADQNVNQPRTGFVNVSKVDWQKNYQTPEDKTSGGGGTMDEPIITSGSGGGIDTTTLGYGAIAAALVLSLKKKKKK
ncbi:MAG: hypothetical protein ABIN80_28620 [Dyadobacter sp.]|uniref:hypothetical protein n=1 Tax=Dyadobacter sp. TaxID=1914288 RepID=UPI003264EF7E